MFNWNLWIAYNWLALNSYMLNMGLRSLLHLTKSNWSIATIFRMLDLMIPWPWVLSALCLYGMWHFVVWWVGIKHSMVAASILKLLHPSAKQHGICLFGMFLYLGWTVRFWRWCFWDYENEEIVVWYCSLCKLNNNNNNNEVIIKIQICLYNWNYANGFNDHRFFAL